MKIELIGNEQKYAVEQALLTLLPEERPVYGTVDRTADDRWAIVELREEGDLLHVMTTLSLDGKKASEDAHYTLSGNAYAREGQRRHTIGISFFAAARRLLGFTPAWGSLTGVRPTKVALQLLQEGGEAYANRVLQDTFFVTPARRRLALECAKVGQNAAKALQKKDISLYVGIPFCPTRCAYCSFVAQSVERSFAMVEPYLAALFDEIDAAAKTVSELGLRICSFYMGGGTPTTLTASQMDRLLTKLETSFDFSSLDELTIEAGRPDTIDAEKLAVLRAHNVTRISVNPQSMNDRVLSAIGRRHTADDIRRAMEQVRKAQFPHVNMDLIAGLPADTVDSFAASLDEAIALGADNITVHTLSLKKGSNLMRDSAPLPDGDAVGKMLDYANDTLRAAGFAPYYLYRQKYMSGSFENVGWTLPGGEGLYNIYIMEELHSILSLGAGGSTKMVGDGKIVRVFNAKYPHEYIERPEKRTANLAEFSAFFRAHHLV